jgi:hypothetical protein
MPQTLKTTDPARSLFGDAAPRDRFAGIDDPDGKGRAVLAARISGARLHMSEDEAPIGAPATDPVPGGNPMLDVHAPTKPPISRIEVTDYIEMGRIVAEWASDPQTQPATVEQLKEQLDGIAVVPDRIRSVEFVQSTLDHLILRLPVKEMIEESLERMSDPMGDGRYPLPSFYSDCCRPGFGPVMTPLDTLLARVGDDTIAQCR